jgi:hypothetical protein
MVSLLLISNYFVHFTRFVTFPRRATRDGWLSGNALSLWGTPRFTNPGLTMVAPAPPISPIEFGEGNREISPFRSDERKSKIATKTVMISESLAISKY